MDLTLVFATLQKPDSATDTDYQVIHVSYPITINIIE